MWGRGMAMRWIAVLVFLAFLGLLVIGIALLWRKGGSAAAIDDAVNTIRMRYANGEMTREEFLQANADLGGPLPGPAAVPPPPPPPVTE